MQLSVDASITRTNGYPEVRDERELLEAWSALSLTQRRFVDALVRELAITSGDVEANVEGLARTFQDIAATSQRQSRSVKNLVDTIQTVAVEDERLKLSDVAAQLGDTLTELIQKIVYLSSRGMSMVYTFDDVMAELKSVSGSLQRIEAINRQTNLLALNARIEAARAGEAGRSFTVLAVEMAELARSVNALSGSIKQQVGTISTGLNTSYGLLREIATIDMSEENLQANARIGVVMKALVVQNERLAEALNETATTSDKIAVDVASAIVAMQFQDRAKQRLENVSGGLTVLGQAIGELLSETQSFGVVVPEGGAGQRACVERLLAHCSLGEMRKRFVHSLLTGQETHTEGKPTSDVGSDEIELF